MVDFLPGSLDEQIAKGYGHDAPAPTINLDKHGVTDKELQKKIAKAAAEWLESRKRWSVFREESTIRLLLTETPFQFIVKEGSAKQ